MRSRSLIIRAGLIGLLDAAVLHGCGQASDPSVPCGEMRLGEATPATVTSAAEAPVIVVSSETPFVVVRVCPIDEECVLHKETLPGAAGESGETSMTPGSAVMVTGLGHYVVAIDSDPQGGMYVWKIDVAARTREDAVGDRRSIGNAAAVLVASLRNSDLVLLRDFKNELKVFDPREDTPEPIAELHKNLKVVAVGSKYIVGREDIDGERERLLLVRADRSDPEHRPDPEELVEAHAFSRVELTANDELVVATSGNGDDAETFVFDVETGALLDRFVGAAVTGLRDLESVPGLRATSPDGSHLAFRTSTGALALRDLQSHSACLVRSSSAGDHQVAGFAADGMIYMQAELDYTESRVFAFDTRVRSLVALDIEPGKGHHLAAVPRLLEGERPYAFGVRHGEYAGMQEDREPTPLGIRDAIWLPRDDAKGGMWAAETYRPSGTSRTLALRHFVPNFVGGEYRFAKADEPAALAKLATMQNSDRPCLSSGTPGAWAYQCASGSSSSSFAAGPVPTSEDPASSDLRDPEVPIDEDEGDAETDDGSDESSDSSTDAG